MVPPITDNVRSGISSHSASRPTASDERVIRNTWYGTATAVMWLPMSEMVSPVHSKRN